MVNKVINRLEKKRKLYALIERRWLIEDLLALDSIQDYAVHYWCLIPSTILTRNEYLADCLWLFFAQKQIR